MPAVENRCTEAQLRAMRIALTFIEVSLWELDAAQR